MKVQNLLFLVTLQSKSLQHIYKSECPRSVVPIVTPINVPVLKIVISGLSED